MRILLIDGNSLLFRTFYATAYNGSQLTTSLGIPVNAVLGFARIVIKLLQTNNYDNVLVAFDSGKSSLRSDMYGEYKKNRKKAPEELISQIGLAQDFLDAFGVKWYSKDRIEADDIIGTFSEIAKKKNFKVDILTSDRDLFQLLNAQVNVLLMKTGISKLVVYDPEKFIKDWGITPKQLIDFKGLAGDSSDNIPGIRGIGPKTATTLIQKYLNFNNIIANIDELKPAVAKKIRENLKNGKVSLELAKIDKFVDLEITIGDTELNLNYKKLISFLKQYELRQLSNQISSYLVSNLKTQMVNNHNPESVFKYETSLKDIKINNKIYLLPIYTNSNYHLADLINIIIFDTNKFYILDKTNLLTSQRLKEILADKSISKVCFNAKALLVLANKNNLKINNIIDDLHIMYYLSQPATLKASEILMSFNTKFNSLLTDSICKVALKSKSKVISEDTYQEWLKIIKWMPEAEKMLKSILKEFDQWKLYRDIEFPLLFCLSKMEEIGIYIDQSQLSKLINETKLEISTLDKQLRQYFPQDLNIKSPKQLSKFLYEDLKLPNYKKNSTDQETLQKLVNKHPAIPLLLNYRKAQKLDSTYLTGLEKWIFNDKKIHPIFNQCQTVTGRLSASYPNVQNIAVRDDEQKNVRKIFATENKEEVYISFDYSQIELRILAHMGKVSHLIDAFRKNEDIHTATAAKLFGIDPKNITNNQRRTAKTVNFGIIYGISAFGLSQRLGISAVEAKKFQENYFINFPEIKEYMANTISFCKKNGYVRTLFNRRRYLQNINSKNFLKQHEATRMAINMPIQGTAADLIKIAMNQIYDDHKFRIIGANLLVQVHDELIFTVNKNKIDSLKKIVIDHMENCIKLDVPLIVDVNVGTTWYDLK